MKQYDIKELGFIPPKYGGVSVSIARLIKQLTADGLIVGGFYTAENKDKDILQSELFDPELNFSKKSLIPNLLNSFKVLRPYRLLHSHYSLEHMFYIWCFLHFLKKKVVITVHNSMVYSFYSDCSVVNRFFLKKVANHCNVTWVAVSDQAKDEMLRLPVSFRQPIHVIPAYIPDIQVEPDSLQPSLIEYMSNHKRNIVFYGHSFMSHEGKDVYGFKDALFLYAKVLEESNDSIGLIFCLTDNRDTTKIGELYQLAKDLHINDRVYWQLAPINNMNAIWQKTDVYIRPTCTDGDSLAVREALDMGVHVVASDVCARPYGTILYKFGNIDELAEKVHDCLAMGKGNISPNFSCYLALKDIYLKLLNK